MLSDTAGAAPHSPIKPLPALSQRGLLQMVLDEGGPGFCQFALNNACNARCGFCNFALDKLPRESWKFVARDGAFDAVDILYKQGIRFLVLTGGEPLLHPDVSSIVERAASLAMKVMLVTNGALLKPNRIQELAKAGLSRACSTLNLRTGIAFCPSWMRRSYASGSIAVGSGIVARRSSCPEVSHVAPPERSPSPAHCG